MENISDLEEELFKAEDLTQRVNLLIKVAHENIFSDPEFSSKTSIRAWEQAKKSSDPDLELRAIISICSSCFYDESCKEIDDWIDLLESKGNALQRYYAIGRANLFRYAKSKKFGRIQESIVYLNKALEAFNISDNNPGRASCYISLGNIEFNQENYLKAYDHYQSALPLVDPRNPDMLFTLRQNIATALTKLKKFHEAWEVYQDVLDNIPDFDIRNRSLTLYNLGNLCMMLGELDASIEYFEEVIKLTNLQPTDAVHVKANCVMAEILLQQEKFDEGLLFLESAFRNAVNALDPSLLEMAQKRYMQYCKELENHPQRDVYQQRIDILGSLCNQDN